MIVILRKNKILNKVIIKAPETYIIIFVFFHLTLIDNLFE